MDIFEQWDKNTDIEGLMQDVESYEQNGGSGGDYEEVPHGNYEVAVEQMEVKASKSSGKPMLSIWFRIVSGNFERSVIFYNQVIEHDWQISNVKKLMKTMVSECKNAPEIKFEGYAKFNKLVLDIFEMVADNYEYELEYKAGKKGFSNYKIKEVFPLE